MEPAIRRIEPRQHGLPSPDLWIVVLFLFPSRSFEGGEGAGGEKESAEDEKPSAQSEPGPHNSGADALGQKDWPDGLDVVHRHEQVGWARQVGCGCFQKGEIRSKLVDLQPITTHVQIHPHPGGDLPRRRRDE